MSARIDLLSAIADYVQPEAESLHIRSAPRNWKDVLNIVHADGLVPGARDGYNRNISPNELQFVFLPTIPIPAPILLTLFRRTLNSVENALKEIYGNNAQESSSGNTLSNDADSVNDPTALDDPGHDESIERFQDIAAKFRPTAYANSFPELPVRSTAKSLRTLI
jgi:hypothetical protein